MTFVLGAMRLTTLVILKLPCLVCSVLSGFIHLAGRQTGEVKKIWSQTVYFSDAVFMYSPVLCPAEESGLRNWGFDELFWSHRSCTKPKSGLPD